MIVYDLLQVHAVELFWSLHTQFLVARLETLIEFGRLSEYHCSSTTKNSPCLSDCIRPGHKFVQTTPSFMAPTGLLSIPVSSLFPVPDDQTDQEESTARRSFTTGIGAYGIIFALAVSSILRKGLQSRGRVIMLIVVVYLYVASLVQFALDFYSAFNHIHSLLMVPDTPIPDRADLAEANVAEVWTYLQALLVFNMMISDAVVMWRTWIVYQGRILAISIPCILLLASFVFTLVDIICYTHHGSLPGGEKICPKAAILGWALSVGTNVICTILVGFKVWRHRKRTRELNLPGNPHRIATERIILTFVDSGFIYGLLWLTQVIAFVKFTRDSPWQYVYEVLVSMGDQITGMYPTLVIVVVNFQPPIWEENRFAISNDASFTPLPWNVKRSGYTSSTHPGVGRHLDTVIDISRENCIASQNVKWPPSE
ncbi:hypothetical protein B0H14DRAFT_3871062 [Mycena olivaceomarginata]|nr:hypothetical protein B0H14DRAFT_3871062 [Mycena olivaceomarginata]